MTSLSRSSALICSILLAACAPDAPTDPAALSPGDASLSRASSGANMDLSADQRKLLAAVRQATARYHDVEAALADGFVSTVHCEAIPGVGGMGIHYVHPARLGLTQPVNGRVNGTDAVIDPLLPEVLLYEPQENGRMRLVGLEYLVFEAAWPGAGHTSPPTFLGRPFDYMADDPSTPVDEAHGFMPHYDLHVWLWKSNPNGLLAQWNPKVSCGSPRSH